MTRTRDLRITNALLYQLSYSGLLLGRRLYYTPKVVFCQQNNMKKFVGKFKIFLLKVFAFMFKM